MNHRAWMLLIAVALVGCDNRPGPIELSTDADVQALGELPGLRATADTRLLDELARIEQQGGTPKLLRREVPDEENVWKGLERLYFPEFRQSNAEKTTEIFKRLYFRRREGDRYLVIDPKVLAEAARGESEGFALLSGMPAIPFPGGKLLRQPLAAAALGTRKLADMI